MIKAATIFIIIYVIFLFAFGQVYSQQKTATGKVIELSLAVTVPPHIPYANVYTNWTKQVKEQTGGKVKIKIFWSESLLKAADLYNGVQSGKADMAYYVIGLDQDRPMNMFTKLIFLEWPSSLEACSNIYHELWNKYPQIRDEFKNVKVLASTVLPPNELSFTKKQVRVPSDMKGLKIITLGNTLNDELKLMGAVPLDLKITNCYAALEKGTADGISALLPVTDGFGMTKLLPYSTLFPEGLTRSVDLHLMNLNTWNNLPPDVRKVFDKLKPYLEQEIIKINDISVQQAMNSAKQLNHTFIIPNNKEMKYWRAFAKPYHKRWIKETAAKGLPALDVYKDLMRLINEYNKKW